MNALRATAREAEPERFVEQKRHVYPFIYPPPSLLLFYPIGHMSIWAAKLTLLTVNHLSLLAVLFMVLVPIAGFEVKQIGTDLLPAFLLIYLLFFSGVQLTITEAQVNLLVLALICLAWWGIRRDWQAWAIAPPLAIACVFKMYPVLFIAMLAVRRRYAAAAITAGSLAAVWGVGWFALPREFWQDWATNVVPSCGYFGSPLGVFPSTVAGNISVAGFMARLFLPLRLSMESGFGTSPALYPHPVVGRALTLGLLATAVLVTVAMSHAASRAVNLSRADRSRQINLQFSAFLILTFLVAPVAWDHHLAYVAPAAVIAVLSVLGDGRGRGRWAVPLVLGTACVIASPGVPVRLPLSTVPLAFIVSFRLYAVLILWAFVLGELYRMSPVASAVREFARADEPRLAID
ncbi:MAG TPA: glycosyltransferase family 87 protein [Tepidisphaeraceae bacterium]|nr:glycosyltransferase family 87 protein [Tepidisphaeraceae bacterium]